MIFEESFPGLGWSSSSIVSSCCLLSFLALSFHCGRWFHLKSLFLETSLISVSLMVVRSMLRLFRVSCWFFGLVGWLVSDHFLCIWWWRVDRVCSWSWRPVAGGDQAVDRQHFPGGSSTVQWESCVRRKRQKSRLVAQWTRGLVLFILWDQYNATPVLQLDGYHHQ